MRKFKNFYACSGNDKNRRRLFLILITKLLTAEMLRKRRGNGLREREGRRWEFLRALRLVEMT